MTTTTGDPLWTPTDAQLEFLRRREFEVLYGGAKGGGKTDAVVAGALRQIGHPRYRALLLRDTFPNLRQVIDRGNELYRQQGASWNGSDKEWTFPSGAKVRCGYLEQEKHLGNYDGQEYQYLGIDQLERIPVEEWYTHLLSCVRSSVPELTPHARSTANPGGPGHIWVKRRFIDHGEYNSYVDPESGLSRVFIPAQVWDNPHILENDPAYVQRLLGLPEKKRKAFLEGDWNVIAGQFFPEWHQRKHIVEPREFPSWWTPEGGFDWGYAAPSVLVAAKFDPFGRPWLFDELKVQRASPVELAERVHEQFDSDPSVQEQGMLVRADPSMGRRMPESGVSILEAVNNRLAELESQVVFVKADNDRASGWARVHQFLKDRPHPEDRAKPDQPYLRVVRGACPYLVETLPAMQHDGDRPEEMADSPDDHAVDALRYLLIAHEALSEEPELERPFEGHEDRMKRKRDKILERVRKEQQSGEALESLEQEQRTRPLYLGGEDETDRIWEAFK